MVDGLPSKPFGSRLPKQSYAKAGSQGNETNNSSPFNFAESRRQEVAQDKKQRQQELQQQYERQMTEFQNDWDKIGALEKKMDLIKNKMYGQKDPTKREQAQSQFDKLKWKVNELYQGSLLTADNAFSTALTPRT